MAKDMKCQADDSAKGERSSAPSSPLHPSDSAEARWISRWEASFSHQNWYAFKDDDIVDVENAFGEAKFAQRAGDLWWGYEHEMGGIAEDVIVKARYSSRQLDKGCKPDERTADSAEAYTGPHGDHLRKRALEHAESPLARDLLMAAGWVDAMNYELQQMQRRIEEARSADERTAEQHKVLKPEKANG